MNVLALFCLLLSGQAEPAAAVSSAPPPAYPSTVSGAALDARPAVAGAARAASLSALIISTSRGESVIAVRAERGHPALAAVQLARVLPLGTELDGDWAVVSFGGQPFRFLLGGSLFSHRDRLIPLVGGAYLAGDTVFIPLQWLTDYIPRVFHEGYRYDPLAARFEEAVLAPTVRTVSAGSSQPSAPASRPNGPLRLPHKVVIDPGHGGEDPGNPGLHFPPGIREKDVTLALAKLVREELVKAGITVELTRANDQRVDFKDRARLCGRDCDLFLSIHVNSLRPRGGYQLVSGFETYFLSAALTAEAARVAEMENEALIYETPDDVSGNDHFAFILKDLQANEYLRESAALAATVQQYGAGVHPGGNRGVHQAQFLVLAYSTRPAILIEAGYATNRNDARFVTSSDGQRKLARAIAEGIVDYLAQHERKTADGQSR